MGLLLRILFLRVVASENTPKGKNMFKVNKKGMFQECYLGVFIITLVIFFKVVTESDFRKSLGFCINGSKGVCNGVSIY